MSSRARDLLNSFTNGLKEFGKEKDSHVKAFMSLLGSAYDPGAMDTKTKELISVALGLYNRCEYCIVFHVYKAFEHGATRDEIVEAAMVSVAFGGGPSMAYVVTLLKESLDEFENDFR
jgi:AhpD family alkylhydroperoxidase